ASAGLGFVGMLIIALSVSWPMTLIAISVIPPGLWFITHYFELRNANSSIFQTHDKEPVQMVG
ncbi:hypothetical protein HY933_04735, partial [Candidatus Falkowbacteria bacterium]|nr:hypothetical protein [Candidatus Falkowbacteria bacterium]